MITTIYDSPVGKLYLGADCDGLTYLGFSEQSSESAGGKDILDETKAQLDEYFAGRRREFSIRLKPAGTAFRLRVWEALRDIGYGETVSYGELAYRIGRPGAARAVGGANHHNPISIIIPCHRVIGAGGGMTGYGGGIWRKEKLLSLERGVMTVSRRAACLSRS